MAGLYIHVPFCKQRCVYCDFYFVTGKRDHDAYVAALCAELKRAAQLALRTPLCTIYLGGGTPSRLAARSVAQILDLAHDAFDTAGVEETTIELNPEDTTAPYLKALAALGINRVSLGIQSFFDDELQFMNRSHDARAATRALTLVADSDLRSFSVDLIFGLPHQPHGRWAASLDRLAAFDPPHVSTYSLTVEERTPLHRMIRRKDILPAANQTVAAQYQTAMDTLRERGLEHYEISSFARPGHRALHNSRYWTHSDYLGIGPSAHSFQWDGRAGGVRWSNVRSLSKYLARLRNGERPEDFRESLSLADLGRERIMLGLRTADGVSLRLLQDTYGVDLMASGRPAVTALTRAGLLLRRGDSLHLTDRGKHVCDSVVQRLVPPL